MYTNAKGIQLTLSKNPGNWMPDHSTAKVITGTKQNDVFYAIDGDTMNGGQGDDHYYIYTPNYTINEDAGAGIDTVYSYSWGVTTLAANVENLFLNSAGATAGVGNALDNIIVAGSVGILLDGGAGDDVLVGGSGTDTFQIRAGNGSDAIVNFTSGSDTIRLQGYAVNNFKDLIASGTQVGSDVRFTFSNNESLVIRNTTLSSLKSDDFAIPIDKQQLSLSFADEFSSLTLKDDGGVWTPFYQFAGGSARGFEGESEIYVDASYAGTSGKALGINPFAVSNDGILSITATPTTSETKQYLNNKGFTSGVISTEGSFSQQYGYFEVRASLPEGQGFWPAFWLLPTNLKGGEIDVFESLGGDAGNLLMSAHDIVDGKGVTTTDTFRVLDPTAMHTYGLNWTKETLTWYVDGTAVATQKTPDLLNKNGEFFMMLNLAVGGWGGTPASDLTGSLKVDYVRAYANSETVSRTVNGVQEFAVDGEFKSVTDGKTNLMDGTAGDDTLLGNAGNNTLHGFDGDDRLDGGAGDDMLIGGKGSDTYIVSSPKDIVVEMAGEGVDTVMASITYKLPDHVEKLTLTGTAAIGGVGNDLANVITGNAAANTLDGRGGADTMIGGAGDDLYYVDNVKDVVKEDVGGGRDTIISSVSYTLAAGQEIETLRLAATAGKLDLNFKNQSSGATWSSKSTGDVTRYEVRAGDHWSGEGSDYSRERSESYSSQKLVNGESYEISFSVMIDPGAKNTAKWMTLIQLPSTLDTGEAGHSPAFALEMVGDRMRIVTRDSAAALSTADDINTIIQYTDATDINRGQWYDFKIVVKLDPSGTGTLEVVRDGKTLVSYTGALGFNDQVGPYLKEGIYRSAASETFSANFKDMSVTAVGEATAQNLNLTGNEFVNTLIGNDGNNILDGGAGADTMNGGKGDDTYYVDNASDVVKEQTGEGNDTIITNMTYSLASIMNVENLTLADANGTGAFNLTGNSLNNILTANAGNNILDGGAGDDIMIGGKGDDAYIVNSADDQVIEAVGGGKDTIVSMVSYTLAAGQEVETLQFGSGAGSASLNLTGNEFANTLIGNGGNNILDGGAGADSMRGGKGDDTYYVDNVGDVVIEAAGEGNDTIATTIDFSLATVANVENLQAADRTIKTPLKLTGNALNNVLTGNAGDNIIDGGAGADTMSGGAGDDIYYVDNVSDVVIEAAGEGNDTIVTSVSYSIAAVANVENMRTSNATGLTAINLTGNALNNILTGNAGSNILDGGMGDDIMTGGAGDDYYIVDSANDQVIEAVGGGKDTVITLASYKLGAGQEIETLQIGSGAGKAPINLTGNEFANTLWGNDGNNILDGGAGADLMRGGKGDDTYIVDNIGDVVKELENEGNDTILTSINLSLSGMGFVENLRALDPNGTAPLELTGNNLDNILVGNAGNNVLTGGLGNDTMIGGAGNDIYIVDSAGDKVIEAVGGGKDTIVALCSYTLAAGQEVETLQFGSGVGNASLNLTGNEFANTLWGNGGNNILDGGAGADLMRGAKGDDTYFVDNAGDIIKELAGEGIDTVRTSVSYSIANSGDVENMQTVDSNGTAALNLTGNILNNILTGNAGNNVLNGGAGDDILIGGRGIDTLIGGAGADTFLFNDGDTGRTAATADVISDFSHAQGDKISLVNIDANVNVAGDGAFTLYTDGQSHGAGSLWMMQTGNVTMVHMDIDGDGKADYMMKVNSVSSAPLVASDFIF
ncbi:family 16 glycosylhydrolase [Sphingobium sp.]|uniref:family 16 glycosylhydrolase n=1 Tax=Sphingobium sp. TaxID=1912891 RepID=UPI003BB625E5